MKHLITILLLLSSTLNLLSQVKNTQIWFNTESGSYSIDAKVLVTQHFIEITEQDNRIISLIRKNAAYFRAGHPNEIWLKYYEDRTLILKRRLSKQHPDFKEYRVQNFKQQK